MLVIDISGSTGIQRVCYVPIYTITALLAVGLAQQDVLQIINVSEVLTIQCLLQSCPK